jgi:uncharacterized protein (DUF433 family)
MQLEDYFTFLGPDDIRIKGHRIGIESVLYEYIHRAQSPESIAQRFPTLSLQQVYATILYYLQNKDAVAKYLEDWLEWGRVARQGQKLNPDFLERVRQARAQHQSAERAAV